jgi:MFS family permease
MHRIELSGSRWLLLVLLNSAFIQAGVYVVRPMVSYRAIDLGADAVLVGFIGSAFAIAPLLFAIVMGKWVDKGRDGTALLIGSTVSMLITIALVLVESLPFLFVAMPVLGIGHLFAMLGGQTMIANRSADKKYERNFGLLTFYASVGHAVGPFVGGILADRGGVEVEENSALVFAIALFVLAALSVIPLARRSKPAETEQKISGSAVRKVLGVKGYKSAIFVAGSSTAVVDVILIFLPVLGRELGFGSAQIGILLAIRALASMGVRVVLGRISDRFGMKFILNGGALITMLGTIALAFISDFIILAIAIAITGFAMGIGQPATMAWVSRISYPEHRGLAISIRLTSNRLGQVVVPAVAGAIAVGGIGTVFFLLAALQAASIVVTERALPSQN